MSNQKFKLNLGINLLWMSKILKNKHHFWNQKKTFKSQSKKKLNPNYLTYYNLQIKEWHKLTVCKKQPQEIKEGILMMVESVKNRFEI